MRRIKHIWQLVNSLTSELDATENQFKEVKNYFIMDTTLKTPYGVENLKKVITFLGAQLNAGFQIDTNRDGKITSPEIFAFAWGLVGSFPGLLPAFGQVDEEAKDLDGNEFNQLVEHVLGTDFLPDERDRAEHYVKALIYILNANRQFITFSIQFFKGQDVRYDPLKGLL